MRALQTVELQSVTGGVTNSTTAVPDQVIPVIIDLLKNPKTRDFALVAVGVIIGIGAEYVKCTTC